MKTNSIFTSTLIFAGLTFLQPFISFILLPIYLDYFSPEEYATFSLINTIIFFTGIFAAGRIFAAIYPYYYEFRHNSFRLTNYLGNILGFTIISGVILLFIFYITGPYLFEFIFVNKIAFFPLGFIAVSISIMDSIIHPYTIFIKNEKKVSNYAYLHITLITISIVIQLVLIIHFKLGILGVLIAKLTASSVVAFIVIIINAKIITFKFKKYYIFKSLKYSLPLILYFLIMWVQRYGDRYIFEHYLPLDTLATYSLLITISLLIAMATDALLKGIQPYLFELYQSNTIEGKNKIEVIYRIYFSSIVLFSALVILLGTFINLITNKVEYTAVSPYLYLSSTIFIAASYTEIFKQILIFKKKSTTLSIYSIISSGLLLFLLFFLIPRHGIWGAITASLIINVINAVSLFYLANNNFHFEVSWYKHTMIGVSFFLIEFLFYQVASRNIMNFSVVSILQFIIIFAAVTIFNFNLLMKHVRKYFNQENN